jgi:hypothetical protein
MTFGPQLNSVDAYADLRRDVRRGNKPSELFFARVQLIEFAL